MIQKCMLKTQNPDERIPEDPTKRRVIPCSVDWKTYNTKPIVSSNWSWIQHKMSSMKLPTVIVAPVD